MKLKPIIASMMLLGLAAPAFADDYSAAATAPTQSQLDIMKAQLSKMDALVNQNNMSGWQQDGWSNRITISGMMNVDAWAANNVPVFRNRAIGSLIGNSSQRPSNIDVDNANLIVDALANDWTTVHFDLLYAANTSTAFTYGDNSNTAEHPTFDEGYVTIANFTESPFFFRAGREYVPFGVYDRYPIVTDPTQLLSQTQATAAQAGFVVPMGFYGSVYGFRGLFESGNFPTRPQVQNWGADLGWAYADSLYSAKLDAGYINNMDDVQYIANGPGFGTGYFNRVSGLALSADGSAWNFDAALRYVTALQDFSAANINDSTIAGGGGAKPAAWGAELGYSFPVLAHQNRVAFGYQGTHNTPSLAVLPVGSFGLPESRFYGNYVVNVSKWTDIGLEVYHDRDYSTGNSGTGDSATVGVLQLGVKFA